MARKSPRHKKRKRKQAKSTKVQKFRNKEGSAVAMHLLTKVTFHWSKSASYSSCCYRAVSHLIVKMHYWLPRYCYLIAKSTSSKHHVLRCWPLFYHYLASTKQMFPTSAIAFPSFSIHNAIAFSCTFEVVLTSFHEEDARQIEGALASSTLCW